MGWKETIERGIDRILLWCIYLGTLSIAFWVKHVIKMAVYDALSDAAEDWKKNQKTIIIWDERK